MDQNITISRKGDTLVITITGLNGKGTPSASGKSLVLASTHGNVTVPGSTDLKLGLNLYRVK